MQRDGRCTFQASIGMERGVVIGGVLIALSLLVAVVLNNYARRDVVSVRAPAHGVMHATPSTPCANAQTASPNPPPKPPCVPDDRTAPQSE